MRVLHLVKTSEGAPWAARLARILGTLGVEVHVALPSLDGRTMKDWRMSRATLHHMDTSLPTHAPQKLLSRLRDFRTLVREIDPDIIHSHFVTTTCTMRMALGKNHRIPRVYQVAGPIHLEHSIPRRFEISLAGEPDYWIGTTRCIVNLYKKVGIPHDRVFLSYYGWFENGDTLPPISGVLRKLVGASNIDVIVGNVNYMYRPKYYLRQVKGVKRHEDVIDALALVVKRRRDVLGVLVGGPWGNARAYEERLRRRAYATAGDRIRFTGLLNFEQARHVWADFALAVHVPISENCGGVPEPMASQVPVIASNVGGLPEVVMPGKTGWLVPPRQPGILARTIIEVLDNLDQARQLAPIGRQLVFTMFDAERTGREVFEIYKHILGCTCPAFHPFDSEQYVNDISISGEIAKNAQMAQS